MKAKKLVRILTASLAISTLTISLSGCSKDPLTKLSKDQLIARVNQDTADGQAKDTRIEELETLLKGVQEEDGPTASISTIDNGTGRLTFNSINNKVIFPAELAYPNSSQAANTSCINITDNISISTTNNWTAELNGASLELNHTNGVTGIIKGGAMRDMVDVDTLQAAVMTPFFAKFPPDKIIYSKIFVDDKAWGLDARTATNIDSKPAYIRCGVFGFGEVCFTYMFLYDGEQDATKDETILALLKTMKIMQQPVRIG